MAQRITQVDAFTDRAFAGNPAAVCVLDGERSESWMQNVAAEMNLAETAFLQAQADGYALRWFTPTVEVDLCGHATLASAHVLWEEGHLPDGETARFHTRSGLLTARQRGEWIELDFPAEPPLPVPAPPGLREALGAGWLWVGRNRMDYLVEVESETILRGLAPNMGALARIEARGVIATCRPDKASSSAAYDFVSRFFAPASGVNEDPVTGSAHCALAPYWSERVGKTEFTAFQASRRGGIARARLEGSRVLLGGQAITILRGELTAAASSS